MKLPIGVILILLVPTLIPATFIESENKEPCNDSVELCSRPYDQVTFPETHNAHASLDIDNDGDGSGDWVVYAANHRLNMSQQYDAGYRAFMIDAHHRVPEITDPVNTSFCHGTYSISFDPCSYGYQDGIELLSRLHDKMNETPRDIVTLLIEVHVPYENLEYIFEESGLLDLVFIHPMDAPWPTLEHMIYRGQRLVVFVEGPNDLAYPWLHDFGTHGWTTDYAERESSSMTCDYYRGDSTQAVWHLNNWLSNEQGLSTWVGAAEVNDYDFLLNRTLDCWEQHGRRPTFIAVDWWTEGDAVNVSRTINEMNHWSDEVPLRSTTD